MDTNNGSGLFVSLVQMLSLITEENYKLAIIGLGFARQEAEQWSEQDCSLMTVPRDNDYTYEEFINWFEAFHNVNREAEKYGGDCEFANGFDEETVESIWYHMFEQMKIRLPSFECRIFGGKTSILVKNLVTGQRMDCPVGGACFIFSEEECKRFSAMDKRFIDLVGELNFIQWSDVFY